MTKSNWTPKFYLCVWIKKWTKKWILLFFLDLYMVFFSVKFRYFFINNFWIVSLNIWDQNLIKFSICFYSRIWSMNWEHRTHTGPEIFSFCCKGGRLAPRWAQGCKRNKIGTETNFKRKWWDKEWTYQIQHLAPNRTYNWLH